MVTFHPHYSIFTCETCRLKNYSQKKVPADCLSGGRYCLKDPDGDNKKGSGRDILLEVLRQLCLFQLFPERWWDYMALVDITCVDNFVGLEKCS